VVCEEGILKESYVNFGLRKNVGMCLDFVLFGSFAKGVIES